MNLHGLASAAWVYLAIFAYGVTALSFVIDKYLLASPIPQPFAYAFWVSALSASAVALIPFGVALVPPAVLGTALASGAASFFGFLFLYRAVRSSDVSIAAGSAGTFTILFSFAFSVALLGQSAVALHPLSVLAMALGIVLLNGSGENSLGSSILAGCFLALSFVLLKAAFAHTDYITGVFWSRMGLVGMAALSLVLPSSRRLVAASFSSVPPQLKAVFVLNKVLVGAGFLTLYYAIRLGTVAVVNALMGFQFVFVFILAVLFRNIIPGIRENIAPRVLARKIAGIGVILLGFLGLLFS